MRTYQTPFMPVASDGVSDTSTSLSRTSGLPEGPLERRADRRFSLNARLRVTAPSLERHGAAGGLTQEGVLCQVEQSGIQVTLGVSWARRRRGRAASTRVRRRLR